MGLEAAGWSDRMWHWLLLAVLPAGLLSMRVDPERIAARLRIEGEDPINAKIRGRRQSPLTKEINIQVTAPLFSSRLFEYGKEAGDQELPTALDVGKKVDLSQPIKFFGQYFSTVYILSNGGIAFDQNSRSYKPGIMGSNTRMIAPYWNRNDLRIGGHVWYRTVKKGRVLERGASEINYQYGNRVKVQMALLVTWEQMQPLLPEKSTPLPENNTNTFQAAIFVTDNGTYANYIFSSVGWTQGAESGFNKGDEKESYGLPTSGTGNIMFLEDQGNTGIPGEWMFEIGGPRVVRCKVGWKGDTCDQQCAKEEWGADCQGCCHCANGGKCDAVTGECVGNGAKCADCWTGPFCQTKKDNCRNKSPATCAANAISFTDYDRCGEGIQRCQCLSGFQGDGTKSCQDIDECRQSGVCHKEAVCRNTPGRFFCQCRPGFQGDGVKECSPAFLYPNEGHHPLPKSKNSKVTWQLKNPLKIMGKTTDKLTISTSGLITLEDIVDGSVKQLDEIHASGIAPFFAPIDISQKGTVTVAETQDPEAMIRAERSVVENFGGTFSPRSLVTVTYTNVSDAGSSRGNTFQTVFIGGLRDKEPVTYVQLLYKDMPWSDMAEAGIMTNNLETSLILPGSGQSLSNLPSLSNIKQPGVWIYRIDGPAIPACPKEYQLPPYCDQTRVDFKSKEVEANLNKKSENLAIKSQGPIEVGGPRQIIPTFDNGVKSHSQPKVQTTARPRPNFGPSTSHKPLVSLGPDDFNVDPDVFEAVTFPAFQTVQPVLATQSVKKLPDFTVSQSSSTVATVTTPVKSTTRVPETEPTFPTFALDNEESVATVRPLLESRVESSESTEIPAVLGSESDETEEGSKLTGSVEEVTAPSPTTEASRAPIFIFSSSTKATTTTTRKASSVSAKRPPNIVTARATTEVNSYEDHNPGLAVIVPSVIVLIWIALIALIFLVVCCKRRSSASRAHNIYGATYGVRPVGYQFKRGSKHLEGSYEDHLEKAARLSTEMGAYSQPSRLSLYGSYWNLNNSSSSPGSGPSTRQSPPFNPTRYTYTGRY